MILLSAKVYWKETRGLELAENNPPKIQLFADWNCVHFSYASLMEDGIQSGK